MYGMKIRISTVFVLLMVCLFGQVANANPWVVKLTAIQGGSCDSFGGGWTDFAYDGKSNIKFCKQVSISQPQFVITDIIGYFPGNVTCNLKFGNDWSAFAYDGKARITFCMKKERLEIDTKYISDVNAFVGTSACKSVFGDNGWKNVIYNGYSNITFCAKFE